jgi:DNA-binding NarL/FixJ family response regulator
MSGIEQSAATSPQTVANVLLLDRSPIFLKGLSHVLHDAGDSLAVAVTTLDELKILEAHMTGTRAVILIIGPLLPTADAFAACRWARGRGDGLRVIFITRHAEDDRVRADAAFLGARACLPVEVALNDLLDVVKLVQLNHTLLPHASSNVEADRLTQCEMNVLRLMAKDKTYKVIADELGISVNTVRNEAQSILSKLGVHDRREAVHRACHLGWIETSQK